MCGLQVSTSRQAGGDDEDPAALVGAAKGRLVSCLRLRRLHASCLLSTQALPVNVAAAECSKEKLCIACGC